MKLVAAVLAGFLALPGLASAEDLTPPGGPVHVEDDVGEVDDVDMQAANWQPAGQAPRQGDQRRAKNRALKQALMAHFDANGDGRLGPRERMRAARVLGKISRKLAGRAQQGQNGQKGQVRERIIKRFDLNGDGHVDRSEMPPGAARKLRRFDRDRDGWVEPGELR